MARSAKKCEKNEAEQKRKLLQAYKDQDMERARIYAENAIREKNQALNFLRLGSRIDAVASRLETAIRMQDVNKAMGQTVTGMANVMKTMNVDQISKTMEQFEKNFEDMDVRSKYMEDTMAASTSMSTPPEQVDSLIARVAEEAGLEVAGLIDSAGGPGTKVPDKESPAAAKEDDLEARLAALKR